MASPPQSAPTFRPGRLRTSSFSSSPSSSGDLSFGSSSFSFNEEFPPFTPTSPLKFKGVPFSWEQIPGIPKHQHPKKNHPSDHLLPPPPPGATTTTSSAAKKPLHQNDPFFAALLECSKDDNDNDDVDNHGSAKITRTLSDRFALISMYASCKRTCAVSESVVYLPRQQNSR